MGSFKSGKTSPLGERSGDSNTSFSVTTDSCDEVEEEEIELGEFACILIFGRSICSLRFLLVVSTSMIEINLSVQLSKDLFGYNV